MHPDINEKLNIDPKGQILQWFMKLAMPSFMLHNIQINTFEKVCHQIKCLDALYNQNMSLPSNVVN